MNGMERYFEKELENVCYSNDKIVSDEPGVFIYFIDGFSLPKPNANILNTHLASRMEFFDVILSVNLLDEIHLLCACREKTFEQSSEVN